MIKIQIIEKKQPEINQDAHELSGYAYFQKPLIWQDVLELYFQLKLQHTPKKILFLLEDIGQCNYTSMHASMGDELYFDESQYIDNTNEQDEDIAYENAQPLAIHYYLKQLAKAENNVQFNQIKSKFDYSEQDFDYLIKINQKPEVILDQDIQIKLVDVASEAEKFVAQLNGYFSCDLNPMESFSLIQHLDHTHGFEYVGLGASLFFFVKTDKFEVEQIERLLFELSDVYTFNDAILNFLKIHLVKHDYLILPYVESLDVFEGCFDS